MMTLATAFKNVYGKVLEEYGFKKVKSKQPYWGRMVGDEILQVITYKNETATNQGCKVFDVLLGIATVYRENINLDISPRDNTEWLNSNCSMYCNLYSGENRQQNIRKYEYMMDNEESIIAALNLALEMTRYNIRNWMDKITDIKSCVENYYEFNNSILAIYNIGEMWSGHDYNEGLLNIMIYDTAQYIDTQNFYQKKFFQKMFNDVKMGKSAFAKEAIEIMALNSEKTMLRRIETFRNLVNDSNKYNEALQELERRKQHNLERLKAYGFEI